MSKLFPDDRIGKLVTAKVDLMDEVGAIVKAGTKIRIVAVAPKVRMIPVKLRDPDYHDGLDEFFNATREYGGPRIRANFCTIKI